MVRSLLPHPAMGNLGAGSPPGSIFRLAALLLAIGCGGASSGATDGGGGATGGGGAIGAGGGGGIGGAAAGNGGGAAAGNGGGGGSSACSSIPYPTIVCCRNYVSTATEPFICAGTSWRCQSEILAQSADTCPVAVGGQAGSSGGTGGVGVLAGGHSG